MSEKNLRREALRLGARLLAGAALAMLMFPALPAEAAKSKDKGKPSFFRSTEVKSRNLRPFKKWKSALKRYSKEEALAKSGNCKSKTMNVCNFKAWEKFLKGLEGKSKVKQVVAVNKFMNRAKYITDNNNWGKKDYWASPGEFMKRFGDCEDYAIAKYMSLRKLGFTEKEMRVVAVKDLNLKVGHAVLVVFVGDKTLLLDNQIKKVVETKSVRHYKPVFSINKKFWWRHHT